MKPTVKRCECGRVSNPIFLNIVSDAWIDNKQIAHFTFDCPQCLKENEINMAWDESFH